MSRLSDDNVVDGSTHSRMDTLGLGVSGELTPIKDSRGKDSEV